MASAAGLRRYLPLGLAIALGLLLSLGAFRIVRAWEESRSQAEFEERVAALAQGLQDDLRQAADLPYSLAAFYDASKEVERDEFATFTKPLLLKYAQVESLEWAPRVPALARSAFEQYAQRQGEREFEITEQARSGGPVPAAPRAEYFPILWVTSDAAHERVSGFDLGSEPACRAVLDKTPEAAQSAAAARATAVHTIDGEPGVRVLLPVYGYGAPPDFQRRPGELSGVVVAVFHVHCLIERCLASLKTNGLDFRVLDRDTEGERRLLYTQGAGVPGAHPAEQVGQPIRASARRVVWCDQDEAPWLLECAPGPDYRATVGAWPAWTVLAGGVLLTTWLSAYLLLVLARRRRVERLIARRTAQLSAANQELLGEIAEREQMQRHLKQSLNELARQNEAMTGRERRIVELKAQINSLLEELGRTPAFGKTEDGPEDFNTLPGPVPPEPTDPSFAEAGVLAEMKQLQPMLESYCASLGIAAAIVDLEGDVLVGTRWQRICTDFHRRNPQTCRKCIESDTLIANQLRAGERFSAYTCKNGLTDAASPIIVNGKHIANFFVGQFLLDPPDMEFFRKQAAECGFPPDEYLGALADVPTLDRRTLESILRFLSEFAILQGSMGLAQYSANRANAVLRDNHEALLSMMEDLIEARKTAEGFARRAEDASQSKSAFLANMSHEIRTPMTAILGFADVLLESGDITHAPPETIEAARTIKQNGEYLLRLIDDILDLSKIEAGKMTTERIAYSPCRLVTEVTSLVRVRADAKGLPLKIEYAGPIPETIQTDPTRLRQILINLLVNAIKFTEVGEVRLVIRFVGDGHAAALQFDVVDAGIGMTAEQVVRLFQPFTQADASTTRKFGGTGLGLAICTRLAQLLGGDITVAETRPGAGTRMRVTVATGPLDGVRMIADPLAATVLTPAGASAHASAAPPGLHGCRILMAEDGPDNQCLIVRLLQKAGAAVTVFENGRLAADAALAARETGRPFDVILMDMQMPVMDGYEATDLLRSAGYRGTIIALTAHAMASDRERCLAAGCDDYASKPIDRQRLLETIARHLRLSRRDEEMAGLVVGGSPGK